MFNQMWAVIPINDMIWHHSHEMELGIDFSTIKKTEQPIRFFYQPHHARNYAKMMTEKTGLPHLVLEPKYTLESLTPGEIIMKTWINGELLPI